MIRPAPAAAPIHYPSSDGKPMAANDAQRDAIMYGIAALTRHFKHRRDVYVSGDLLIYYEEGNPRVSVAPDVFEVDHILRPDGGVRALQRRLAGQRRIGVLEPVNPRAPGRPRNTQARR